MTESDPIQSVLFGELHEVSAHLNCRSMYIHGATDSVVAPSNTTDSKIMVRASISRSPLRSLAKKRLAIFLP